MRSRRGVPRSRDLGGFSVPQSRVYGVAGKLNVKTLKR